MFYKNIDNFRKGYKMTRTSVNISKGSVSGYMTVMETQSLQIHDCIKYSGSPGT